MIHELLKVFCFQYKIVSVQYFLDELQPYEINTYIENIKYLDTNNWEQTRLLMYVIAQVNSKKQLDVKDILKFAWDNTKLETEIKTDDIQRLKERSKQIQKQLQQQIVNK